MQFSYHDLKESMYILQTLVGVILLIVSGYLWSVSRVNADPSYIVSGMLLTVVGLLCLIFGLTIYVLRDEQDVWR